MSAWLLFNVVGGVILGWNCGDLGGRRFSAVLFGLVLIIVGTSMHAVAR